jgi:uncharacterized glyoxalase superfamily protein PhnB
MKTTDDTSIIDLKAFVPAKDPALSRQFYLDLGFKQNWANEQIAEFQIGAFRFLLQNFYAKGHAENFMMHLTVANADAWWEHIQAIKLGEKYPGIMLKPPAMQPWGLRVLYLSDPTGVLWHIAEPKNG